MDQIEQDHDDASWDQQQQDERRQLEQDPAWKDFLNAINLQEITHGS